MDWQQPLSLLVVAIAVGWMFRSARRRKGACSAGGGAGCGCSGSSTKDVPAPIVFRARRGERRQIIIKT